ncbi:MAG: hypothetical protein IAF94_18985 [Pirellulaceae bacterium]|nr:hypothetical protein [Pirellulaceae bacterium]
MCRALELVELRCDRIVTALASARIPYAIIGGQAVKHWVESVDEGAGRNTPNTDALICRADVARAISALCEARFDCCEEKGHIKLKDRDRPTESKLVPVDGFILIEGERFRDDDLEVAPQVTDCIESPRFRFLLLEPLVKMKLVRFRIVDRVHFRDLMGVGLVDETWPEKFPAELACRLKEVLDDPIG